MTDFDNIFRKYYRSLLLYALKFVQVESEAMDIVQDVFIKVFEKKRIYNDEEHLKAYLFSSVRNKCINYLKHEKIILKHHKDQFSLLTELEIKHYENGEDSLIEKENIDRIYEVIGSLSGIYREVIELSRFEGLKNKEIAKRLNIPVRTVETRLFRALSTLKEKLSEKEFHIFLICCHIGGCEK